MKMNCNFYRLATGKLMKERLENGAIACTLDETTEFNEMGYDIFWTTNGFEFGKRTKKDLLWINGFYADLDSGSFKDMQQRVSRYPEPTSVIKTGKGFHCYWNLDKEIDCSTNPEKAADWFRDFTRARIQPALNADPQACDACHLLRPAFYRYWKDGKGEIFTDVVYDTGKKYSLEFLKKYFPEIKNSLSQQISSRIYVKSADVKMTGSFWERANLLDCKTSLEKLSGTAHVNGEVYKITSKRDGTYRVACNGKPSNVWIDKNGMIGSTDRGGPVIPNWLYWYQQDWKKVAKIIEEVFEIKGEKI